MEDFGASLHVAYGVVQKEFVGVPDWLLGDTPALRAWFAMSVGWVGNLKPKPTRRSRS